MSTPEHATGLSQADRAALADRIDADVERTSFRLADLEREFAAILTSSLIAPPDDEHDPEGATIGFERAQVTSLLEAARTHLADLQRARDRLDGGAAGTCAACGQTIPVARLLARPATDRCVACVSR